MVPITIHIDIRVGVLVSIRISTDIIIITHIPTYRDEYQHNDKDTCTYRYEDTGNDNSKDKYTETCPYNDKEKHKYKYTCACN